MTVDIEYIFDPIIQAVDKYSVNNIYLDKAISKQKKSIQKMLIDARHQAFEEIGAIGADLFNKEDSAYRSAVEEYILKERKLWSKVIE